MSGYIGAPPVPQATQTRQSFTATASQTSFATAGYTPNFVDVYMNGVHLLDGTDYTATNGSDVVLTSGAAAGDVIEVVAYSTYQVNDQAFTGDFTVDTDTLVVDSTNDRVGLGTTSPAEKLHVEGNLKVGPNGTTDEYQGILVQNGKDSSAASTTSFIDFRNDLYTPDAHVFARRETNGSAALIFGTTPSGSRSTDRREERMRITSTGAVGINTTAPSSKLMVNASQSSGVADLLTLRDASAGTTFNLQTYADPSYGTSNRFDFNGGYLAFRRSGTEAMRIDNGAYVYVHTQSNLGGNVGSAKLHVLNPNTQGHAVAFKTNSTSGFAAATFARNANNGAVCEFFHNVSSGAVGRIDVTSSSTSYVTSSDYRLKEDVQPMTGASERVLALNPVNFAWIADGTRVDGFLAHEAQTVVPEAVTGVRDAMRTQDVYDEDGNITGTEQVPDYQGIDQSKLVPLLTAALQEALGRIETLETKVSALEANT